MGDEGILSPKAPPPGFSDFGGPEALLGLGDGQAPAAPAPGAPAPARVDARPASVKSLQNTSVVFDEFLTRLEKSIASIRVRANDEHLVFPRSHILFTERGVFGGETSGWLPGNEARRALVNDVLECSRAFSDSPETPSAADGLQMQIENILQAPGALQEIEAFDATAPIPGQTLRVARSLLRRWDLAKVAWAQARKDFLASSVGNGVGAHVGLAFRHVSLRQFLIRKVRPRMALLHDIFQIVSQKARVAARPFTVTIAKPPAFDVLHVKFAVPPARTHFGGLSIRLRVEIPELYPNLPPTVYLVSKSWEKGPCPMFHPNVSPETGEVRYVGRWVWPLEPPGTVLVALTRVAKNLSEEADLFPTAVLNPAAAEDYNSEDSERRKVVRARVSLSAQPQAAAADDSAIASVRDTSGGAFFANAAVEPADPMALAVQLPQLVASMYESLKKREAHIVELRERVLAVERGEIPASEAVVQVKAHPKVSFGAFSAVRGLPPAARAKLTRCETYTPSLRSQAPHDDAFDALMRVKSTMNATRRLEANKSLADLSRIRSTLRITPPQLPPAFALRPRVAPAPPGFVDPRSPSVEIFRQPPPPTARQSAAVEFMQHFAESGTGSEVPLPRDEFRIFVGTVSERLEAIRQCSPIRDVTTLSGLLASPVADGILEGVMRCLAPEHRVRIAATSRAFSDAIKRAPNVHATAMLNVALRACWRMCLVEREDALFNGRLAALQAAAAALEEPSVSAH